MPCDQIRFQQIDYKNANVTVLKAALEAAEFSVQHDKERDWLWFSDRFGQQGTFRNGAFQVQPGFDVDLIKRNYAQKAIETAQKKNGWTLKNKTSATKGTLARRTF